MPDPDLSTLVVQAQKGDRTAFEKIVHATARVLYSQIVAAVRDRQKAEDITQDTYIAAWKALATVENPAGMLSWLLTLARNTTLDAIKFEGRKKREGNRTATALDQGGRAVADHAASPPERAQQSEARDQALALLDDLPEEYRRPLAMRYLAGADYNTICRQLALSDGALRGLLNRGMALLRERMTQLEK